MSVQSHEELQREKNQGAYAPRSPFSPIVLNTYSENRDSRQNMVLIYGR
jgi:hypothetical protein